MAAGKITTVTVSRCTVAALLLVALSLASTSASPQSVTILRSGIAFYPPANRVYILDGASGPANALDRMVCRISFSLGGATGTSQPSQSANLWTFNGEPLAGGEMIRHKNLTVTHSLPQGLMLNYYSSLSWSRNVTKASGGTYRCGWNGVYQEFEIIVNPLEVLLVRQLGKDEFMPSRVAVLDGDSRFTIGAEVYCLIRWSVGFEKTAHLNSVYWKYNGQPLVNSGRANITVRTVLIGYSKEEKLYVPYFLVRITWPEYFTPQHTGIYTCGYGSTVKSFQLVVNPISVALVVGNHDLPGTQLVTKNGAPRSSIGSEIYCLLGWSKDAKNIPDISSVFWTLDGKPVVSLGANVAVISVRHLVEQYDTISKKVVPEYYVIRMTWSPIITAAHAGTYRCGYKTVAKSFHLTVT